MEWFCCSNNECPACRTHCSSRRSLREDRVFDELISVIYPNIDEYEEKVISICFTHCLVFHFQNEKKKKKNLINFFFPFFLYYLYIKY